jgi:hypothetical protein
VTQGTPLCDRHDGRTPFNRDALISALQTDQAGQRHRNSWRLRGEPALYVDVDFSARTVAYYGCNGEEYVEAYPLSKSIRGRLGGALSSVGDRYRLSQLHAAAGPITFLNTRRRYGPDRRCFLFEAKMNAAIDTGIVDVLRDLFQPGISQCDSGTGVERTSDRRRELWGARAPHARALLSVARDGYPESTVRR